MPSQHGLYMDFAKNVTGERWQQQDVVVAEALELKAPAETAVAQPTAAVGASAAPFHLSLGISCSLSLMP